ncbi:hypothetical protein CYMTET_14602 [Cymbomonas tetramitiformis]|uniref:Calcineurin-like phosphoesterase domain-containing protein n=1 Tax=Cymbomonas tetramitiformis TaxID=36881 RepID=A0AAE0GH73_9CHLO|nr:hypothetical protein CYMTET_14602 [Cymbomonas tetramitiformis]
MSLTTCGKVQKRCRFGDNQPNVFKLGICRNQSALGSQLSKSLGRRIAIGISCSAIQRPQAPLHVQAPGRVVAVGDLHGDIQQALRALKLAEVINQDATRAEGNIHWVGGNCHLVQTGDLLDRGNDEIALLGLFQKLGHEAEEAGGAIHVLTGNHEILNVSGDFRYVTPGAFQESDLFAEKLAEDFGSACTTLGITEKHQMKDMRMRRLKERPEDVDEYGTYLKRIGLYAPGGLVATQLANHPVVLVVNNTLFVHGGLQPNHVRYGLRRLNGAVGSWMRGEELDERTSFGVYLGTGSRDSAVWDRTYSMEDMNLLERTKAARLIQQVLEAAAQECEIPQIKRMVVGHTVQCQGVNSVLEDTVWRIDVGTSRGVLGVEPQVLEIADDQVRVLRYSMSEAAALERNQQWFEYKMKAVNPDIQPVNVHLDQEGYRNRTIHLLLQLTLVIYEC